MITYREMLREVRNDFAFREGTEWTNTWIDCADRPDEPSGSIGPDSSAASGTGLAGSIGPDSSAASAGISAPHPSGRILLVGDSTARKVRSSLARLTGRSVDMIGTSANLYDEIFVNLLDGFFRNTRYSYAAIFVQIGQHGRKSADGGEYRSEDFDRFREDFRSLLTFLRQFAPRIITESIFDAVVPPSGLMRMAVKLRLAKEKYDGSVNAITRGKSRIIEEVAGSMGVDFLDINAIMNRTRHVHADHIHYGRAAQKVIAAHMKKKLEEKLCGE